ncbi:histidine kinase [Actinoplanes sp. NPDC051411]|uniref:sensor histidine kinase n=1 Tax=Actinoplanes sp. NPDC051411 TaxID=3155522 RepID=UPI003412FC63
MPEPFWRSERVVDRLVAGAFGALAVVETGVETQAGTATPRLVLIFAAGVAAAVLLLWRRQIPVTVVLGTATCAALVSAAVSHPAVGPLAPAVALYTLATLGGWRRTALVGAATLVVLVVAFAARRGPLGAPFTQSGLVLGAAALIGLYAGGQRQISIALAAKAAQLKREQNLLAREAVLTERVWIARELHDVIGHHVSLLVVQAGAVRSTIPNDHPARPVCDSMILGGKEAMTEMRRMVDLLRPTGDTPDVRDGFGPPPSLADIPALCDQLRQAGLRLELVMPGECALRPSASVAAYRIVQEALTNVLKHAGPVATRVRIHRHADTLDLRITNAAGRATSTSIGGARPGHGQDGMRQRARLFSGDFLAGPVPDGGYAVHATLNLGDHG